MDCESLNNFIFQDLIWTSSKKGLLHPYSLCFVPCCLNAGVLLLTLFEAEKIIKS